MSTKLKSYFSLCPLADNARVWGVARHSEDDCIVVTSSQNMVSRYKVAEQRPLNSWSSREGFVAPVMFDEASRQYVGLVQRDVLRVWAEEHERLDRLKKFKFSSPVQGLVEDPEGRVFVVFAGGVVLGLAEALERRKQQLGSLLPPQATLLQSHVRQVEDKALALHVCRHGNQVGCSVFVAEVGADTAVREVSLSNEQLDVAGVTLCRSRLCLLSLWSDGGLTSHDLMTGAPARTLGHVEGVQAGKRAALVSLSEDHVAVYAADAAEEGATLVIYNTRYQVSQARQRLKLYTSPPGMWGPYNSKLVLASGGSLLVAPYVLARDTLATMLGSANRKLVSETRHARWEELENPQTTQPFASAPESIRGSLEGLAKLGFTESAMCERLLPPLLDHKKVREVSWFLHNMAQVPEGLLARVVSFCLREDEGAFSALSQQARDLEQDEPLDEISASLPPESPLGGGRLALLDSALHVDFNCSCLLPEVRRHLAPQEAILVLRHAASRLWHGDPPHPDTEKHVGQLVQWCCVLLDANYQHCLLSMDTQVLHTLTTLSDIVDTQLSNIEELRSLEPYISRIKLGQELPQSRPGDHVYVVESIRLY